jgi:DNA-binding NarL/FixJ family response regulator
MDAIRILVADSHPAVRKQITARLQREPDFDVVAEAGSGAEAINMARTAHPDIILIDPDGIGVESIQKIMAGNPDARVMVLTAIADTDTRMRLAKVGVNWILAKELKTSQLVNTLHQLFDPSKIQP